jgi:hypothetical protein
MRNTTAAATIVLTLSHGVAIADDNRTDAVRAHMSCVRDHVATLDDGKIDPKRLAEMIVPVCHSLHEASEQAVAPQVWSATPADKQHEVEFMHTWAAVLWSRESLKQGR